MSSVDNRIVKMTMDDKDFTAPANRLMQTLSAVNEKCQMKGASAGLDNVSSKLKGVDTSYLSKGVETITAKFSKLDIIGVTALTNITNQAVNAGKNLVKSLTVDPILAGMSEYELKLNSVQTIMASTGKSIGVVSKYLDELNTYSDRTIYSFSDMTENIGKFTNNGVALEDSVLAIKGISNAAALSGANANEASRAMYNFAQALSSGSVKLIDWKSIELANMGTKSFKEELMKTAAELGTITKRGKEWVSTTTNAKGKTSELFTATKGFNESLNHQWMTTDVLVKTLKRYTDENTELGRSAYAAASDVKSLSQMLDVMKETAQSGWAQTWEIVFGTLPEAKKLWTPLSEMFNEMIQSSSDYRNSQLKIWNDWGGRTALMNGIVNILKAIGDVLQPIDAAFKKILKPMNGYVLADLSKGFERLTQHLKMSDETSANLQKTFEGLFSIVKMVGLVLKPIGKLLSGIFKSFTSYGDSMTGSIFEITGGLGENITKFVEWLENSVQFQRALMFMSDLGEKLGHTLKWVTDGIGDMIKKLGDWSNDGLGGIGSTLGKLASFIGDRIGDIIDFGFKLGEAFNPFELAGAIVTRVVDGIRDAINGLVDLFGYLVDTFGDLFKSITDGLPELDVDIGSVLDLGVIGAIVLGLKKLKDIISDVFTNLGGFSKTFVDALDTLKGTLEEYQKSLKADRLMKLAAAILMMSVAVNMLSKIEPDKLVNATVALAAVGGVLMGLMYILTLIEGGGIKKSISQMSLLLGLSISMNIMATALSKLAKMNWEEIGKSLTAMGTALLIMTGIAKLIGKTNVKMSQMASLVLMANAMLVLATALALIGMIPADKLSNALLTMGVALGEMAVFIKLTKNIKGATRTALALIPLAIALNLLAGALAMFGSLDGNTLTKGLITMGVALTQLGLFAKLSSKMSANLIFVSTGLLILAGAMVVLSGALAIMGNMDLMTIAVGLGTMAASLIIMGVALRMMPKTAPIVATGVMIMSAAFYVLAGALGIIGNMSLGTIATGLITIAASLAIFGVSSMLLGPIIPLMLGVGAAMTVFGVAAIALGAGLAGISAGISAFCLSMSVNAGSLLASVSLLMATIPIIAAGLGKGLVTFIATLGNGAATIGAALLNLIIMMINIVIQAAPKLLEAAVVLITTLCNAIIVTTPKIIQAVIVLVSQILLALRTIIPQLAETLLVIIESVMASLAEHLPKILEHILTFIGDSVVAILAAIAEYTPQIIEELTNVIVAIIEGIGEAAPKIVAAIFKMVIDMINGFADAIETYMPQVRAAVWHLISVIVKDLLRMIPEGLTAGMNLVTGIGDGLRRLGGWLWDRARELGSRAWEGVKSIFRRAGEIGRNFVKWIGDGISNMGTWLYNSARNLGNRALQGVKDIFKGARNIGRWMVEGLGNGIKDAMGFVVESARNMASNALGAVRRFLGIHSPSREFRALGVYSGQGMAIGIDREDKHVQQSARQMAEGALDSVCSVMSNMGRMVEEEANMNPVIKPVVDLDDVDQGINAINQMSLDEINGVAKFQQTGTLDKLANLFNAKSVNTDSELKRQNEKIDGLMNKFDKFIDSMPEEYRFVAEMDGTAIIDKTVKYRDLSDGRRQSYYDRGLNV